MINIKKGQFLAPESMIFAVKQSKRIPGNPIKFGSLTEEPVWLPRHDCRFREFLLCKHSMLPVILDITTVAGTETKRVE